LVLARKPAAVQLSWLGYLKSTGLAAVDFRISDAAADPVGLSDAVHAERVVRLAGLMWAFEPPKDAPQLAVRAPDARITFGSFNHPAKINDAVLSVWAQLLLRVPTSKLIIAGIAEDCGRERIAASLQKNGVETARLYFYPRLPKQRFLELVATTDVALDPFPYNGGATTCDCLWMGVPVVTLAGSHGFARSGASLLAGAGLAEWVASSVADYVDIAARMAQDRQELAALRGVMRQRLLASELCDVAAFARRFEDAVIEIWRGECT
jgi:predicted O-linked N-acetylglucosamine transferase (SPINDLY family)